MTNSIGREELLQELRGMKEWKVYSDREQNHMKADTLLLSYIDDPEITEAFEEMDKWYS